VKKEELKFKIRAVNRSLFGKPFKPLRCSVLPVTEATVLVPVLWQPMTANQSDKKLKKKIAFSRFEPSTIHFFKINPNQ
jgi:hypothetical protein